MCALIYQKVAADRTLILNSREAVQRAFNFGNTWTEIRMGMFFGGVTTAGDNTQAVNEVVNIGGVLDRILMGIKNSSDTSVPGQAGSLFVGVFPETDGANSSQCNGQGFFGGTASSFAAGGFNGTTQKAGTSAERFGASTIMNFGLNVAATTGYCGFTAIKFVLANRGLATQQFTLSMQNAGAIAGADYSDNAAIIQMNNGAYGASKVVPWNDGAAAYAIPDAFYLRMPFYNNRIRLSSIVMRQYA